MTTNTNSAGSGGKTRHEVCPVSELPPGKKKIVQVGNLTIGVFNVKGEFYALANVCPHQLAPLCEGRVTCETIAPEVGEYELIREGEIIQCPWHGWKFDIATGNSVFNPHKLSTPTFDVAVETPPTDDDGEDETANEDGTDVEGSDQQAEYGTELMGDQPPIDTYEVEVEAEVVVLYV
ncbi:Rieske (2Fe-2S) protein (plasmid) [Halorarum halophilum]|uniref:Rieske (2Fe-2S) protein n=1 Tax=Halorarum halophilum TaxID=2743090 RepID=A0A7D5KAH4_9EURY|nr:Rieske (2Fe-2S) protein [Halobaculum halophilum]QLG29914.1 Rieske (2Fe-2S) protein [Halobaculum halophilum]